VGGGNVFGAPHDAHAAAAAAGDGLDHHSGAVRQRGEETLGLRHAGGSHGARQHVHAALGGHGPGRHLVAEALQHVRPRPDEHQPGLEYPPGEVAALGEKAVARVHGVAAGLPGQLDQRAGVEVAGGTVVRQRQGPVGTNQVQCSGVVGCVHGDAVDAQPGGGIGDADGDLAAIGDEQTFDHGG